MFFFWNGMVGIKTNGEFLGKDLGMLLGKDLGSCGI